MKTRRVFVSMPADNWLTAPENELKWAIVSRIEKLGYVSEVFFDPRGTTSLAASRAWSAPECEEVMRRCEGCALLGFPRWRPGAGQLGLPTDFSHYEGGLAYTLKLPLLTYAHEDIERRVVFDRSFKGYVGTIPRTAGKAWLRSKAFDVPFKYWTDDMAHRRDIFLGYCSSSASTAKKVKTYLTAGLGLSVLDWATDFDPARTILKQIDDASRRCGAGIFLFTKDDELLSTDLVSRQAPRDNVVFEAGYFAAAKGKARMLVVLEAGAKMPADLGGDIYAALPKRSNIDAIKPVLSKFAASL